MKRKSVLITGSSRGLGKLLAEKFINQGYFVYGASRGKSTIFDDENYRHFGVDIGSNADVMHLFQVISSANFPLEIAINSAAIGYTNLCVFTSYEDLIKVINTNLIGAYLICQNAIKIMARTGFGRIVNISSINLPLGSVGSSAYNVSKAGLEALAKPIIKEFPNYDITMNTLGLSLVKNTDMLSKLTPAALKAKKDILLKPNELEIEEIMNAISFFCSPLSRNITGQTLYFGGV